MRNFFYWLLVCCPLFSHPHVFVEAGFEVVLEKEKAHVRVLWQFDEMTSMMLLMDFDTNGDGILDAKEVAFLKEHAFDHLEPFGYYTVIGKKGEETPPPALSFFHARAQGVHLFYEFAFSFPLKPNAKTLTLGCYDKDNLVAFFLKGPLSVTSPLKNRQISYHTKRENRDFYDASLLQITWKDTP